MAKRRQNHTTFALRHAMAIGLWALLVAAVTSLLSQTLIKEITWLLPSVLVLAAVVAVGIVFDIIGVAVTAADEAPLHARAAQGSPGAREAAGLVQNAHQVASFCNDVVGDVSGTLSGAIGVAIVYQAMQRPSPLVAILATSMMASLLAGVIVGGKAFGKVFAIHHATEITLRAGRFLAAVGRLGLRRRPRLRTRRNALNNRSS